MGLLIFYVANVANVANVIQSAFCQMPTMLIYAKIAAEHGISEDRVRQIIRSTRPPLTPPDPLNLP